MDVLWVSSPLHVLVACLDTLVEFWTAVKLLIVTLFKVLSGSATNVCNYTSVPYTVGTYIVW